MKKLIAFSFTFLITISMYSQTDIVIKSKNNLPYTDIDTLCGLRNKLIRYNSDTLFVINRFGVNAFQKCVSDLQRVKNLSSSLDQITTNMNHLNSDVNSMYGNMQILTGFINDYSIETKKNLNLLEANNNQLNSNLMEVNKQLAMAQAQLKAQRKKNLGTCLIWGAGGITVGGLLAGLLLTAK